MRLDPMLWVQGNPFAEELWAHFGLSGGGFNFHNLWYEMGVDLGYLGILMSLLTVLIVSARAVRWAVRAPSAESFFSRVCNDDRYAVFFGSGNIFPIFLFHRSSSLRQDTTRNADRIKSARPRVALSATLPLPIIILSKDDANNVWWQ
jgi:hypothetical protein